MVFYLFFPSRFFRIRSDPSHGTKKYEYVKPSPFYTTWSSNVKITKSNISSPKSFIHIVIVISNSCLTTSQYLKILQFITFPLNNDNVTYIGIMTTLAYLSYTQLYQSSHNMAIWLHSSPKQKEMSRRKISFVMCLVMDKIFGLL